MITLQMQKTIIHNDDYDNQFHSLLKMLQDHCEKSNFLFTTDVQDLYDIFLV